MNHVTVTKGEAHVQAQIEAVPHQSDAYRELLRQIEKAGEPWQSNPKPLKIRMKATGAVLELGYVHARDRILSGVATLVE